MIKKVKIGNRIISNINKPLIIAEVSANHQNSLKKTFQLLNNLANAGVEVVKFQTFNLDDMTMNINKEFLIKNNFKINLGIQDLCIAFTKKLIYLSDGIKKFLKKLNLWG